MFAGVLCVGLGVVDAAAITPGAGGFSWSYQDTGLGSNDSVVAMRNGSVFPVVANGSGDIAGLYSSGWIDLGNLGNVFIERASSSSDGRVAFSAGIDGVTFVSSLPFSGFTSKYGGYADFSATGTLVLADDVDVIGLPNFPLDGIQDVAVSPTGEIGVLASGDFWEYIPQAGVWNQYDSQGVVNFYDFDSLTYDSYGRAHMIGHSFGNGMIAADFNQQTGEFEIAYFGSGNDTNFHDIAANEYGVVGTSFVDAGVLYYAYNDNNAGWLTTIAADYADNFNTGIAYDYEGLPVISYSGFSGIEIAYDPIVTVPEPGVALLLLGTAGLVICRRRVV